MKRLGLLWVLPVFLGAVSPALAAYRTKNVFICVMDGVRYSETFGDPEHENIPHMWNDLRPHSFIFMNFKNTGVTVTRQGHSTIATGTWQTCPNGGPRMSMPSVFDYYRDELGAPQSKTWAIFGKGLYAWLPYSSFPVYRDTFAPSFEAGIGEKVLEDDNKVLARLLEVMEKDRPSLVLVNFGYTDHSGHLGVYEDYLKAIRNVDRIFYEIWQRIQSDPYYKDTTTLILLNDHGRHDDSHGGFKGHGDACEGCRHIMLQILGPDTKKNTVIERPAFQIDIAPTVGELLGFQTPLAKGEVLSDCLASWENVNKKEARTNAMVRAVAAQQLAERDLAKVVGDRLRDTVKPEDLGQGLASELVHAALGIGGAGFRAPDTGSAASYAGYRGPYADIESAFRVIELAAIKRGDPALAKESVYAVA